MDFKFSFFGDCQERTGKRMVERCADAWIKYLKMR